MPPIRQAVNPRPRAPSALIPSERRGAGVAELATSRPAQSPSACSLTPSAGGSATPRECRPGWRGSGDTPAASCNRNGALIEPPAHLPDETVHIDHQPPVTGTGAGPLRAHQRLPEQLVQLAHMPEGEGAQERAQRRGCRHPATRQPPRLARSQDLAVIDAVRAEHHREHQRRHLAPGVRGARPLASQPDQPPRRASIPKRLARVATSITPASETARSSSNSTRRPSSPTGSSSCTLKVTSCPQAPAAAFSR